MTQKDSSVLISIVASSLLFIQASFSFVAALASTPMAKAGQEKIFVTELHGKVSVTQRAEPVALLDALPVEAVIQLSNGARLVAFYSANATEYHVQGPGSYRVAPDALLPVRQSPLPVKKQLQPAYRGVKVQTNSLVQAGIVLRAPGRQSGGMQPASEKVDPADIRFRWSGNVAAGTRIELRDDNDVPVWAAIATAPPMALPTEVQLVAGKTYRWQLAPPNTGRTRQTWLEFDALPVEMTERIRLARPADNASVSEHVAFYLLLDSLEAHSMAQNVWAELAAKHPEVNAAPRKSPK